MPRTANKKAPRRRGLKAMPETGLVIHVGWQANGGVYLLDPASRERIRAAVPGANVIPNLTLGYDKTEDFERFHRPHWPRLALILTGLTEDQVASLGGVRLYDPAADAVLWEWQTAANGRRG